MNKFVYLAFFIVLAAEVISATQYAFNAQYKLRESTFNGDDYVTANVFYRFDTAAPKKGVIHYKITATLPSGGSTTVSEFQDYSVSNVFKICSSVCEGSLMMGNIEPWWYNSTSDTKTQETMIIDGATYTRYTRQNTRKTGITDIYLKKEVTQGNVPADVEYVAGRIVFGDGRSINITRNTYKTVSFSDTSFTRPSGVTCSVKACKSYLDIVFVLDESGSILSSEFTTMKTFVRMLVGNLTIGVDAAAISVVMFASNARTIFELSYGNNIDGLITNIVQKNGGTYQGKGLSNAITILNKDTPRRQKYGKPTQFVIALTDGEDASYSTMKTNANTLKNQGVFLIEVGVGITKTYAEKLKDVASTLNGVPGYFDVKNFAGLLEKINELVVPICENSDSQSCDPKCHGYCGCGSACYCPSCVAPTSKCIKNTCTITGNTTAGCKKSNVVCDDKKSCTTDTCDPSTGCKYTAKKCTASKSCQTSTCSETLQGKCDVKNVDSRCPDLGYPCYKKTCDPDKAGSDAAGCNYEYLCVGKNPVVYKNGKYEKGCYEYTCVNTTGKCTTTNVCTEKLTDKCKKYTCDESKNMCVSQTLVTCKSPDGCLLEATCNPSTGKCEEKHKSEKDCLADLKAEAAKHVGDENWFASSSAIAPYYNCGQVSCVVNPSGGSTTVNVNQNKHCVFTRGSDEQCGACSGTYPGQPTFESCTQQALEMHNNKVTSCFKPTCKATSATTSKCEFTEIKCAAIGCKIVTCNQDTFQCESVFTKQYNDTLATMSKCQDIQCDNNNVARLVDISVSKCSGDHGENVPVCMKYDRCDAEAGCIYSAKCVKQKNCTTMSCNAKTNTCVEEDVVCPSNTNVCLENVCDMSTEKCVEVVKPIEKACDTSDICINTTCDINGNTCVYRNKTDLVDGVTVCRLARCDTSTGEVYLYDKCDDGRICTIDECDYDGNCTHMPNTCDHMSTVNMSSCFYWSCSESRKNGCYRKIYDNSRFDECGNCMGPNDEEVNTSAIDYTECKKALTWEEKAAVISAGVAGAIVAACIIGAIGVSVGGTLLTRELIKRARAAADSGAVENPMYQDNGREMSNPAFEGEEMDG